MALKAACSSRLLTFVIATSAAHAGAAPAGPLASECGELASKKRYAAPAIATWVDALKRAFATLPNDKSELTYFNPPQYSGFTGRPLINATTEKPLPNQDGLDRNSARTLRVPIKGDHYGGGSIAFGGEIFANENFKWRFSVEVPEDRSTNSLKAWWLPITIQQPWLEWRAQEGEFLWRAEDAQTRLLCRLLQRGATLQLFRGTTRQEAALLDILKSTLQASTEEGRNKMALKLLELVNASRSVIDYYKARDGAGGTQTLKALKTWEDLLSLYEAIEAGQASRAQVLVKLKTILDEKMRTTDYGAFFTSFERERAKGFAKGALLSFEFPVSVLLDLSRQHLLYVGIENDIEVAFLPGMDLTIFVDGFLSYELVESQH